MQKRSPAFPAGLYGMLLFALAWLTLPSVFTPVERWAVGAACLVPRVASSWLGEPVLASDANLRANLEHLNMDLVRRIEADELLGARAMMPVGLEPELCGVSALQRRGGGGEPAEVVLERSYRELDGCSELVTKGSALVGFLLRPGVGPAADDDLDSPARVLLLHHARAPRLYAELAADDGVPLRVVVRPSAAADPAPLRVDLWDDPFRAMRLERSGKVVRTLELPGVSPAVPGGLVLGRTRHWGYEPRPGEEALTIGVFLEPPIEVRALSYVVLWRASGELPIVAPPPRPRRERAHAVVLDLPGATHGRHLLTADRDVPDGAAVLLDGVFLGTARRLAFRSGLVTAFVASRQRWSLVLLPDDPTLPPRELHGRVESGEAGRAVVRWLGADVLSPRQPSGYLFTGSNGPSCPPGLLIGHATPHAYETDVLDVAVQIGTGPHVAEVVVGGAH
jgi:hypothetical protein